MARPTKNSGQNRVFIFGALGIIVIVAIILLLKTCRKADCPEPAEFTVVAEQLITDIEIEFRDAYGSAAESWEWDFGDSSAISTEQAPRHVYRKAGIYVVTLTINESCPVSKTIEILQAVVEGPVVKEYVQALIEGPVGIVYVNEPVQFFDKTPGAVTSWDWEFGESGEIDSHEQSPFYTFTQKGKHTVVLTVNGNQSEPAYFDVDVQKKMPTTTTPAPSAPKPGGGGPPVKPADPPKREELKSTDFFRLLRQEAAKEAPNYRGVLGSFFGGTLNAAQVVLPEGTKMPLTTWIIREQMAGGGKFPYSNAEFDKDQFGDITTVKLKK
jgi:hypothetical protein